MANIKEEATVALQEGKKYVAGTIIAVDLYANGNFFEALLQHYRTDRRAKDEVWAYMKYLDDKETKGWVDLNATKTVELNEENILTEEGAAEQDLTDERGFLGRRLTVKWVDDARYTGTITKIMKDNKNFVFITYDNGDKCWYNLSPATEEPSQYEETQNTANSKSRKTTSKKVKKEKEDDDKDSNPEIEKFKKARKDLEKKYPVGCTIAVDIYRDEHYHDAKVTKYLATPTKKQMEKGEQWVHIQFLDNSRSKQWIDLNYINVIRMTPENTLRLSEIKPTDEKGFLGKRLIIEWPDGNKYRGVATKSARDNKHFVYVEYDDGDECWCDLQLESEWNFDDEERDVEDDAEIVDDTNSSDESVDVGSKRKRNSQKLG